MANCRSTPVHSARVLFTILLCATLGCSAATAQERTEENERAGQWSADISFINRNVWRGFLDGDANSVADATYSRGPWEFCVAATFELASKEERRETEIDLYVTRRIKLGPHWSLAAGYDYYGTPQEEYEHAHEFWTGIDYSGAVDLSLKAYQFAVPHTGSYFSAAAGRKIFSRGRFSLNGEAALGFNRHMTIEYSGFSDAAFTLTPAFRVSRGSIAPFISYSKGLDKRYFDDHVVFGLKYAMGAQD
jgi:hypothetical protein